MADLERAESIIVATQAQADRVVTLADRRGRVALRALARALQDAHDELEDRLDALGEEAGGPGATFTRARATAYRRQVDVVLRYVQRRLRNVTVQAARGTQDRAWMRTAQALRALENAQGGSVTTLRIETASMVNRGLRGQRASLLQRAATSLDRYGERVIRTYEMAIERGILVGASQSEMIDALVGRGGPRGVVSMAAVEVAPGVVKRLRLETIPEGLFKRYRYWAARLVRTEVASAQNAAALESMRAAGATDFPDLQKKILAILDNRTASDSIAVHGQIRDLDQPFIDGAGRVYQYPPARPNDREVVIPWRPGWRGTPRSRRLPESIRDAARRPARDLPARWGVDADEM